MPQVLVSFPDLISTLQNGLTVESPLSATSAAILVRDALLAYLVTHTGSTSTTYTAEEAEQLAARYVEENYPSHPERGKMFNAFKRDKVNRNLRAIKSADVKPA